MSGGVDRRTLFKIGAVGAVASTGLSCSPARDGGTGETDESDASVAAFELDEISVDELRLGMEEGRWTSRTITELYLGRIEEIDRDGPRINSMIMTNPDALEIAEGLDEERRVARSGRYLCTPRRIHHQATAPGRCGDSGQGQSLGVGKFPFGTLVEWLECGVLGQTRNPFALDSNSCGSSSGSGASVSANLTALAIGTETDGSVVCPSNANGIVGIKPTVGLVSRSGIVPVAHSQDTAGPMARSVRDAAILLGAIAGEDPQDVGTKGAADHIQVDYTQFLDGGGLDGARIGVWRECFGFHEKVDSILECSLEAMSAAGTVISFLPALGERLDSDCRPGSCCNVACSSGLLARGALPLSQLFPPL